MLCVCTHFFSLFQYLLWYVQKVHISWCNAFSVMIKQEVLSLLLIFPNSFYLIIADKDCISVFFKCSPCCFGKSAVLVVFSWNLSKSTRQCWRTHSSPSVRTVLRQSTQFSVNPHSSPSVHTVLHQSTQFSVSPHSSPSVHTVLCQSTQFSISPHSFLSVHTVLHQSTQFSVSPHSSPSVHTVLHQSTCSLPPAGIPVWAQRLQQMALGGKQTQKKWTACSICSCRCRSLWQPCCNRHCTRCALCGRWFPLSCWD